MKQLTFKNRTSYNKRKQSILLTFEDLQSRKIQIKYLQFYDKACSNIPLRYLNRNEINISLYQDEELKMGEICSSESIRKQQQNNECGKPKTKCGDRINKHAAELHTRKWKEIVLYIGRDG